MLVLAGVMPVMLKVPLSATELFAIEPLPVSASVPAEIVVAPE